MITDIELEDRMNFIAKYILKIPNKIDEIYFFNEQDIIDEKNNIDYEYFFDRFGNVVQGAFLTQSENDEPSQYDEYSHIDDICTIIINSELETTPLAVNKELIRQLLHWYCWQLGYDNYETSYSYLMFCQQYGLPHLTDNNNFWKDKKALQQIEDKYQYYYCCNYGVW